MTPRIVFKIFLIYKQKQSRKQQKPNVGCGYETIHIEHQNRKNQYEKLQRDAITEETVFKDEDVREVPVIKYEPETIKELRDKLASKLTINNKQISYLSLIRNDINSLIKSLEEDNIKLFKPYKDI